MVRTAVAPLLLLCGFGSTSVAAHPLSCDGMLPVGRAAVHVGRPVTNRDIIELRDIGDQEPQAIDKPSPISISPDGRQVAFVLSRADVATNSYCRALVVLPLVPRARPRIVDSGGELLTIHYPIRGLWVDYGVPTSVTPVWSKSGRQIFYLKRLAGRTALWRIDVARRLASAATNVPFDIETVVRPAGANDLLLTGRPGMVAARSAIADEARRGWLYDRRIVPGGSAEPRVSDTLTPEVTFALDTGTGVLTEANAAQRQAYQWDVAIAKAEVAVDGRGWRAAVRYHTVAQNSASLEATGPTGAVRSCTAPACGGWLLGAWWNVDGMSLTFLKREGANNELSALYRWSPTTGKITQLLSTSDVVQNCAMARLGLVCTRENATHPRRIVEIDPVDGSAHELFDPNPETMTLGLGHVERLHWTNSFGLPAWGDLVLPPGASPGHKLPLVVVQYFSRGFLRGGTNNEYPIFPLAARGLAVLSVQRPPWNSAAMMTAASANDRMKGQFADWQDFRNSLASIEAGIAAAAARGHVDTGRMGITGLSDGAAVVRFALINTHLFKAAAISGCCMDPTSYMAYGGTAWADAQQAAGFPRLIDDNAGFWKPVSIAENAADLDTPLLIQASDEEYLLALEGLERLREYGQPAEMFVFPGEHHGKFQPIHKLAVADRADDWFDFWLDGKEDPDPAKRDQYERWRKLRTGVSSQR